MEGKPDWLPGFPVQVYCNRRERPDGEKGEPAGLSGGKRRRARGGALPASAGQLLGLLQADEPSLFPGGQAAPAGDGGNAAGAGGRNTESAGRQRMPPPGHIGASAAREELHHDAVQPVVLRAQPPGPDHQRILQRAAVGPFLQGRAGRHRRHEDRPMRTPSRIRETGLVTCGFSSSSESPQRVRGKAGGIMALCPLIGINPAHAGKSRPWSPGEISARDHPRTCGEKGMLRVLSSGERGSPPHMRGKARLLNVYSYDRGITPAHAGKSGHCLQVRAVSRDHPRTCGEKVAFACRRLPTTGSPPHMRGKVFCR